MSPDTENRSEDLQPKQSKKNLGLFIGYVGPLLLYIMLIFSLSSITRISGVPKIPFIDKIVHFIEYSILGFLALRLHYRLRPQVTNILQFLIALTFVMTIGSYDEYYQSFRPHRSSDFIDLLADVAGGICGPLTYLGWRQSSLRTWTLRKLSSTIQLLKRTKQNK